MKGREGPHEELKTVVRASGDVATDVVLVVGLLPGGGTHVPGEDEVAEAGGEALDLAVDLLADVARGALRHVGVGPERVMTRGRARRVDDTRLRHEDVGPLGMAAGPHLGLGGRHLGERAAQVKRAGDTAHLVGPGDGSGECVVDLARARTMTETLEAADVAGREPVPRDAGQLPRRDVEQHGARARDVGHAGDMVLGDDLTAELDEVRRHGAGDALRSTDGHRPAGDVTGGEQHHPERAGEWSLQWEKGVRRRTSQQRGGFVAREAVGEPGGRAERSEAEAGHRHRMARGPQQRSQDRIGKLVPVARH